MSNKYTDKQDQELARASSEEIQSIANSWHQPYATLERRARLLRSMERGTQMTDSASEGTPSQEALDEFLIRHWDEQARKFLKSYVPLPQVPEKIQTTVVDEMDLGEHQGVALFSDYHFGSKIDARVTGGLAEYNEKIARKRLARWRDGVLRFTQMQQVVSTVEVLHIFALGDDLEGHGAMFGTQSLQLDESVFFQYMGFVEDLTDVLISLTSRYKKIYVHKVYGNHGRIAAKSKDSYGPDNLELMAWQNIKDRCLALEPGKFEFNISTSFFLMLEILGYTFYIRHGHMIGGLNRTYTGALDNKLRMNSIVGEVINYMVKAHLHEAAQMEGEIGGMVIQNGCFVGPSLLSVEGNRAAANLPSQEMFFIHPTHGIVNSHRITLATAKEVRRVKVWGRK